MSRAQRATALNLDVGEQVDDHRIYDVDPQLLVLGPNARIDTRPDPDFTASLEEHGVLHAITCYLDDLGQLVVETGQRRAQFAAAIPLATVPVRIRDRPTDIDRISHQVVENDQRADLSTSERAGAVQQLAAFGVPLDEIARRTSIKPEQVQVAMRVAASKKAVEASEQYDLTLDQAAAVAEFDDDSAVSEQLLAAAGRDGGRGFDHVAQRARNDRRDAESRAAETARLRADGQTVLDERPPWNGPAEHLTTLDIKPGRHRKCPGHAAYLAPRYEDTGVAWVPVYVCTDWRTHGHTRPGSAPAQGDLDRAAKAAERAEVIEVNKQWRAAEAVRRRWLRDLAQQKTPPAGAERFVMTCLLRGDSAIYAAMMWESQHQQFRDLMGLDREARDADPRSIKSAADGELDELVAQVGRANPKRVTLLLTVLVLAAWEERTSVQSWRSYDATDERYLRQMMAWGYEPSPVERRLLRDETSTT